MMQNQLLNDAQHVFVSGRNCMTQLLLCIEEWTFNVDKCKSIQFGNKNPNIEYHMHGITLDNVQDEFGCNH